MKCFGRAGDDEDLLELSEVTIRTDVGELRALSAFIRQCADEMERHGDDWEHEHLQDSPLAGDMALDCDVIVLRPS